MGERVFPSPFQMASADGGSSEKQMEVGRATTGTSFAGAERAMMR